MVHGSTGSDSDSPLACIGLNSLVGMFLLGIHLRMQDSDEDPDTTAFKLAIKSLTILFTVLASWGIAYLAS